MVNLHWSKEQSQLQTNMAYFNGTVKNTAYIPENLIHRFWIYIIYIYIICIIYIMHFVLIVISVSFGLLPTRYTKRCENIRFTFINVTFPTYPPVYFKLMHKKWSNFSKKLEWISGKSTDRKWLINACYQFSNNTFHGFSFHSLTSAFMGIEERLTTMVGNEVLRQIFQIISSSYWVRIVHLLIRNETVLQSLIYYNAVLLTLLFGYECFSFCDFITYPPTHIPSSCCFIYLFEIEPIN